MEHDETSAYELWTKLEEMYREKTSQNKALLKEACVEAQEKDYSGETRSMKRSEEKMAKGKIRKLHFKCFYCNQEGQYELSKERST